MLLAPSQWEEGVRFPVDVGPGPAAAVRALRSRAVGALRAELVGPHVDYPAAQAYATGLLALHCLESAGTLTDAALEAAARRLRCFSFFGGYRLGEDGRQAGHDMVVIQWYQGVKRVVWPLSLAEAALVL
jgi:branched-chain amino acid transport system substrate-binding protein